jgi:hypothetical protein
MIETNITGTYGIHGYCFAESTFTEGGDDNLYIFFKWCVLLRCNSSIGIKV